MKYVIAFILIIGGVFWLYRGEAENYQSISYQLAGEEISLGETYRYFGNEIRKDLDGDGQEDIAFLVSQNTRFYLAGALSRDDGYKGTSLVMLGDNVHPQNTESGPGRDVIVNLADERGVGKSLYLRLDQENLEFGEVVQNFEGETR